jgi:hypothetical protein
MAERKKVAGKPKSPKEDSSSDEEKSSSDDEEDSAPVSGANPKFSDIQKFLKYICHALT